MKFGIIGAGRHGQNRIMPAIVNTGHEVSAIYSRDAGKAGEIGLKYNSKPYDDLHNFLAGDFDAVYISSPNFLHYEHTMAALKSGKDVLLEKQMTLKNEHAEELVKVAEAQNLKLAIGYHMRFHPAVEEIRQAIEKETIGKPIYISGMFGRLSPSGNREPDRKWWDEEEKSGGGSIMGYGVHVLDTINYVVNEAPVRVSSSRLPKKSVIENTECVNMVYSNFLANAISSRELPKAENSLYVFGTEGTIAGKNIFNTKKAGSLELNGEEVRAYDEGNLYEEEVRAFVSSTKGEKTKIADGNDGLVVVKTVNAAIEGDFENKWIEI